MRRTHSCPAWLLLAPLALLCAGCPEDERILVNVQRHFATPQEEALIDIAEHTCPPREDVLAAANPDDVATLEAEAGENCLWWYGLSYIKIPYAITVDTIDYFVCRIDQLRHAPSPYPLIFPDASLDYQAVIEFRDSYTNDGQQFENVYLVHMTMSYSEAIAPLAGTFFDKQRQVVLTPEGEVLAVFGDGPTAWWVA